METRVRTVEIRTPSDGGSRNLRAVGGDAKASPTRVRVAGSDSSTG